MEHGYQVTGSISLPTSKFSSTIDINFQPSLNKNHILSARSRTMTKLNFAQKTGRLMVVKFCFYISVQNGRRQRQQQNVLLFFHCRPFAVFSPDVDANVIKFIVCYGYNAPVTLYFKVSQKTALYLLSICADCRAHKPYSS